MANWNDTFERKLKIILYFFVAMELEFFSYHRWTIRLDCEILKKNTFGSRILNFGVKKNYHLNVKVLFYVEICAIFYDGYSLSWLIHVWLYTIQ